MTTYSLSNSTIKKLYGSREVVSLWTNEFRRQSTYRAVRHEHTEEDEPNPRWRKGRRDHQKPLNRGAAFENVTRQKQAIVTEMRKRDFTRMWQYITNRPIR